MGEIPYSRLNAIETALGGRTRVNDAYRGGAAIFSRQRFSFPGEYSIPGSAANVMAAMPGVLCGFEAWEFPFVVMRGEVYAPDDSTNPGFPINTLVTLAAVLDSTPPAAAQLTPDNLGSYGLMLPNMNTASVPFVIADWNPLLAFTGQPVAAPVSGHLVLETSSFHSDQTAASGAKVRNLVIDVVKF